MNSSARPTARFVSLAVWAALVSIAFAASAAARVEVRVLDRPSVVVLAHSENRATPRSFEARTESDDDFIDPQIAVTNVGPPVVTIPSVTIARESQTLSLVVKVTPEVESPSTTSLPTVEGTSETNTTTTKPDGELSYTGPRGSLLWETVIAASMVILGARLVIGSRRRRQTLE